MCFPFFLLFFSSLKNIRISYRGGHKASHPICRYSGPITSWPGELSFPQGPRAPEILIRTPLVPSRAPRVLHLLLPMCSWGCCEPWGGDLKSGQQLETCFLCTSFYIWAYVSRTYFLPNHKLDWSLWPGILGVRVLEVLVFERGSILRPVPWFCLLRLERVSILKGHELVQRPQQQIQATLSFRSFSLHGFHLSLLHIPPKCSLHFLSTTNGPM